MAFRGYEADVRGVPMDDDGMRVDVLASLLAGGLRPKIVYTIPDYQNPTGLSMSADRRMELVGAGPPLWLPDPGGRRVPGAWLRRSVSPAPALCCPRPPRPRPPRPPRSATGQPLVARPDVVLQAGTFSKIFFPGVRLGWAAGPQQVIGRLVVAKQNSDQCSGALGQRMLEEYGRGGHLDRQIVASRALYARRAELVTQALAAHMPDGTTWTTPRGGFYVWLTAPDGVDTVALSAAARDRKVAYVPGRPFYPGDAGATQLRLAYSRVADDLIDEGIRRIGEVLKTGLEGK